jgi:hypothetical protein
MKTQILCRVVNKINDKQAIVSGITVKAIWQELEDDAQFGVQTPLHCDIREFGKDSFETDLLASTQAQFVGALEEYFIEFFEAYGKDGYHAVPSNVEPEPDIDVDAILFPSEIPAVLRTADEDDPSIEYVGVKQTVSGKWTAVVMISGHQQRVGVHATKLEAAWARDKLIVESGRDYGNLKLNFSKYFYPAESFYA